MNFNLPANHGKKKTCRFCKDRESSWQQEEFDGFIFLMINARPFVRYLNILIESNLLIYRNYNKGMIKLYFLVLLTFLLTPAFAQRLAKITIDNTGNSDVITFLVDETVLVNLTREGKIIDWGIENNAITNIYPGRLDKYMGKEEYYPSTQNEAYRGKVKYIGRTLFTYYTSDEGEALKGKVKTIGTNLLDYYKPYDDPAFKGYLKDAGPVSLTYYSSFDNEAYKGKIKTVGSTTLTYYGSFDDKAYRGKIKNIDRTLFTYYSSYDRKEYSGILKTGSHILYSGSIKYFIKN